MERYIHLWDNNELSLGTGNLKAVGTAKGMVKTLHMAYPETVRSIWQFNASKVVASIVENMKVLLLMRKQIL